jgi:hypothetical protein
MAERSHSIPAEGTDVGIIGGLAVALWFLVLDTIAGKPLLTPSLLGQVVLMGDPTPETDSIIFGAILLYTAFHFIARPAGMGLVAVVHWGTGSSGALRAAADLPRLRGDLYPPRCCRSGPGLSSSGRWHRRIRCGGQHGLYLWIRIRRSGGPSGNSQSALLH